MEVFQLRRHHLTNLCLLNLPEKKIRNIKLLNIVSSMCSAPLQWFTTKVEIKAQTCAANNYCSTDFASKNIIKMRGGGSDIHTLLCSGSHQQWQSHHKYVFFFWWVKFNFAWNSSQSSWSVLCVNQIPDKVAKTMFLSIIAVLWLFWDLFLSHTMSYIFIFLFTVVMCLILTDKFMGGRGCF